MMNRVKPISGPEEDVPKSICPWCRCLGGRRVRLPNALFALDDGAGELGFSNESPLDEGLAPHLVIAPALFDN